MRKILAIAALAVSAFGQSFPSSVYTPLVAKDNIATVLNVNMLVGDNVAIVASTTGWASNMVAYVCDTITGTGVAQKCTTFEVMLVTSVSGANVLNVTRGYGGSTAGPHVAGKVVANAVTAVYNQTLSSETLAIETALGANLANVVTPGGNNTFTGTNTFNGAVNARGATHTSPIKTGILSAIPATCTVGEQYFATDAPAGGNLYLCTATNTFTPATTLPSASSQLQYLRSKPDSGNLTTFEFSKLPTYNSGDYDFAAQSPGTSISGGGATITMSPCPLGVNGTDSHHNLYLSGGSGTAEAPLITGGTCAGGGVASGTVILATANSHSGGWTVTSATGGLQEAQQAIYESGVSWAAQGTVKLTKAVTLHATVYGSGAGSIIWQGSSFTTMITRGTDFLAGSLFNDPGTVYSFKDVTFDNGSNVGTQSGITIEAAQTIYIQDVIIFNGYVGVKLTGQAVIRNLLYLQTDYSYQPLAAIWIEFGNNIMISELSTQGSQTTNANSVEQALYVNGVDTLNITNCQFAASDIAMHFVSTTHYVANVNVSNTTIIDNRSIGVFFQGVANATVNVVFSNVLIQGDNHGSATGNTGVISGLMIGFGTGGGLSDATNLSFTGVTVTGWYMSGVFITDTGSKIVFSGCNIHDNNLGVVAGEGGLRTASGSTANHVSIVSSIVAGNNGTGISFVASGNTGVIVGNDLTGNTGGPLDVGPAFAGVVTNNYGVDNALGSVASATSVAIPLNQLIFISGTTTTTTLTGGWAGRRIRLVKADSGSLTVGGGGNIPGTHTLTQNQGIELMFDGANWI